MVMKIDGNGVIDPHSTGAVQIGVSTTATNNFTITPTGGGAFKIARGNIGATTQDILTFDNAGRMTVVNPDPWVVSTPTPIPGSGSFGSASAVLRTRKVGPMVFYKATIDITNLGTVGNNTTVALALPYPALATTTSDEWDGAGRESKLVGYLVMAFIQSGGSTLILTPGAGSTMGNGHRLNATGFYETAS